MTVPEVPYQFALVLGMVAALNPCGFALLPTYLMVLVSTPAGESPGAAARRALLTTVAMTAGFVGVFGLFGLVVVPTALSLERFLPWATIVIGGGLVVLGCWLISGRELLLRIPRLGTAPTRSLWSVAGYGVAYAVASLSCTVAPFLALTASAFSSAGLVSGLAAFVTYGAGMGLVVGLLAVTVAVGNDLVVRHARRLLPRVNRISGALLVPAGAYVTYYGGYELRVNSGDDPADPVVDAALSVQGTLAGWVSGLGPGAVAVGLGVALVAATAPVLLTRRAVGTRRR